MTDSPANPGSVRQPPISIRGLLEAAGLLLCLATAAGFLGRAWWVFELTTHFKVQLAVLLFVIAAILLARKRWALAGGCALFGLINMAGIVTQFLPENATPRGNGPGVALLGINVQNSNQESHRVLRFVKRTGPDIILLMEVSQQWMNDLETLRSDYPYQVSEPRDDNFGIALFSRLPLTNAGILYFGEAGVPSVVAGVIKSDHLFHLVGTHPLPPGSADYARLRNEQLLRVSEHVRKQTLPVVVLGDLNATPWSPYFRSLLKHGHLKDSSRGHGTAGSWPARFPPMRIPLDHCLVSPDIHVKSRSLGPAVGGDHLPLLAELVLPDTRNAP